MSLLLLFSLPFSLLLLDPLLLMRVCMCVYVCVTIYSFVYIIYIYISYKYYSYKYICVCRYFAVLVRIINRSLKGSKGERFVSLYNEREFLNQILEIVFFRNVTSFVRSFVRRSRIEDIIILPTNRGSLSLSLSLAHVRIHTGDLLCVYMCIYLSMHNVYLYMYVKRAA